MADNAQTRDYDSLSSMEQLQIGSESRADGRAVVEKDIGRKDAVKAKGGVGLVKLPLLRDTTAFSLFSRVRPQKTYEAEAAGGGGGLLLKSFFLMVLMPTLGALAYLSLVASDVFVSEAKITVREAMQFSGSVKGGNSLLSQLDLGGGGDTAQNSSIVMDYVKSRAVIEDVGGAEKLHQVYGGNNVDFLSRLPADENLEGLWKYWKEHVTASVDTLSGILTLRVRAYQPDDALSLSSDIIGKSEDLINRLSIRSKQDALERAKSEVDLASALLADARSDLLKFQQSKQTIDPTETAKETLKLISSLTLQKTAMENQLETSASLGVANKPGEQQLRARLDAINAQIAKLNATLTGEGKEDTVSTQLRDFELLKIQEEFANYMYKLARSSFERARQKLERQDLYLAVVVPPNRPDSATYPRIFPSTALIFAGLLIAWGVISLLVASVKDSIRS